MKQKAIIIDIDNTLANIDHRLHFIKGEKDWKSFFKEMKHDKPNKWCVELVDAMYNAFYEIVFITCRPIEYQKETVDWLNQYIKVPYELEMRPNKKEGDDGAEKLKLYNKIKQKYDILFVVDDRDCAVEMWRKEGLPTLQCDYGSF